MVKIKKETSRGGKRKGSGAKHKYGEPTVNLVIRVPVSKKAEIKMIVQTELKKYIVVRAKVEPIVKRMDK